MLTTASMSWDEVIVEQRAFASISPQMERDSRQLPALSQLYMGPSLGRSSSSAMIEAEHRGSLGQLPLKLVNR